MVANGLAMHSKSPCAEIEPRGKIAGIASFSLLSLSPKLIHLHWAEGRGGSLKEEAVSGRDRETERGRR